MEMLDTVLGNDYTSKYGSSIQQPEAEMNDVVKAEQVADPLEINKDHLRKGAHAATTGVWYALDEAGEFFEVEE